MSKANRCFKRLYSNNNAHAFAHTHTHTNLSESPQSSVGSMFHYHPDDDDLQKIFFVVSSGGCGVALGRGLARSQAVADQA
mmetsp:Transcript_25154/g.69519  ORF Transcript_25154/g.69519 Transcript_25154/m.69519 type:complete len:81 (-) Transcript_25154:97-339(-)